LIFLKEEEEEEERNPDLKQFATQIVFELLVREFL
jgi:hypothetical protein